ncbi:MAG: hypothetical protein RIR69_1131 [Actinomycetota bacterium]|jgi:pimeloyl-ACP methyl ester carboxylesterase
MTQRASEAIRGAIRATWRDNGDVPDPFSSRYLTVRDGVQLRLVDWSASQSPSGIPILLLHGLASNARLWDGPARYLTDFGHRVVAVDLRGHGQSEKTEDGYAVSDIAADVADIITQLCQETSSWKRPLVIGQSWGGNIVIELAATFGDLIRGVVAVDGGTIELCEAFPGWDECARTLQPPHLAGMKYDRLRSYIRAAHPDWSEEAIDGQMHNMQQHPDGTITPWLTFDRHMTILRNLWEHRPSQLWNKIDVPVMFTPAAKTNDDHVAMKRQQIAHALSLLPAARVEWFEPADHDLHAQFPQQFSSVIDHAISTGFFA